MSQHAAHSRKNGGGVVPPLLSLDAAERPRPVELDQSAKGASVLKTHNLVGCSTPGNNTLPRLTCQGLEVAGNRSPDAGNRSAVRGEAL
jgi:hypothetical protein